MKSFILLTKYSRINVVVHTIAWLLVTIYLCLIAPVNASLVVQIPTTFLLIGNMVFVYYFLLLTVYPKLFEGNYVAGISLLVLTYLVFVSIDFFNFSILMPSLGLPDHQASFVSFLHLSFYPTFIITAACSFANFSHDFRIKKMVAQNEREKTVLLKELNFLKNQFHSHITFNFLNYCYSKVHQTSKETGEAIELFSDMLRHSLLTPQNSNVSVSSEMEYIRKFIQLQKLLSAEVHARLSCRGNSENLFIVPHILITFVENAFRHGEFHLKVDPVTIDCEAKDDSVVFSVYNRKRKRKSVDSTGIGLCNVRQLLNIYYEGRHTLDTESTDDHYKVQLEIILR